MAAFPDERGTFIGYGDLTFKEEAGIRKVLLLEIKLKAKVQDETQGAQAPWCKLLTLVISMWNRTS